MPNVIINKKLNVFLNDFTGILDLSSTQARVALSLRKLSVTYRGYSIKVRRSSDNAEQNIGFYNNELDETSLLNFVGSGNGYVVTWYDQSGNSNHLTQSTTTNQPLIVSSGVVIKKNTKPTLDFDNTDTLNASLASTWKFMNDGTQHSIYVTLQVGKVVNPAVNYPLFGTSNGTTANTGFHNQFVDTPDDQRIRYVMVKSTGALPTSVIDNQSANGFLTANTLHYISILNDPSNGVAASRSTITVDSSSDLTNNALTGAPNNANPAFPLQIGGFGNGSGFVGYYSEFIVFPVKQPSNVNTIIKSNINNFFFNSIWILESGTWSNGNKWTRDGIWKD